MPLVDDPRAFILRMFELEIRDGRGDFCELHREGVQPDGVPLRDGELVYGIYKSKYFYSPTSLIIHNPAGFSRIPWAEVAHCSTKHGGGDKTSTLGLVDGSVVKIQLSEFVKGWAGRTSQLYHGMIERWGAGAGLGAKALTVDEFFSLATDDYSFASNQEPHPTLDAIRSEFEALMQVPNVDRVAFLPCNGPDEELAVRSVVVLSRGPCPAVDELGKRLKVTHIGAPDANTLRLLGIIGSGIEVRELLWD